MADYIPLMQKMQEVIPTANGAQPGEPEKGVKLMVDVIRGEGVAEGKKTPHRMAVGSDAVAISRLVAEERLKGLEEWGDLGKSTDFDVPKQGLFAELERKRAVRLTELF
jgi:hypothetical protein